MADRIVILNAGRIEQEGPPEEVYNRPETPFVAKFMGAENAIEFPARLSADRIEIPAGPNHRAATLSRQGRGAPVAAAGAGETPMIAYFRSEAARLAADAADSAEHTGADEIVLSGHITGVSYPGGTWRHAVQVGGRDFHVDSPTRHAPSERVRISLPSEAIFLFPREGVDEAATAAMFRGN